MLFPSFPGPSTASWIKAFPVHYNNYLLFVLLGGHYMPEHFAHPTSSGLAIILSQQPLVQEQSMIYQFISQVSLAQALRPGSKHIQCTIIIIDREAREIMYLVASVHPSVRLSVTTLTPEPFVCVSVISRRRRIIAQMRSIGVLIICSLWCWVGITCLSIFHTPRPPDLP